jgi:protein TonB
MSLEASGGAGAVHPILGGGGGRRGLPRWVWLAVLIVLLIHAAVIVLLSRMGVIQTPLTPPADQTLVLEPTYTPPPPPQVQPRVQHERTTPPVVDHPTPTPTKPVETLPVQTSPQAHVDEGPKTVTETPKPVEAKTEPTAPPVIGQPHWLSQPSAAEMARFYPAQAADDNVEGRAVIRCSVTVAGTLTACTIVQEQPRGYGFGRSAVQLSQYFRMTPRTEDGRPVGGATVDVAIAFKL